jgi:hypothetical protein
MKGTMRNSMSRHMEDDDEQRVGVKLMDAVSLQTFLEGILHSESDTSHLPYSSPQLYVTSFAEKVLQKGTRTFALTRRSSSNSSPLSLSQISNWISVAEPR